MPNLRIAELDFDEIKSNLKAFLQNQNEFTDYDFEGSSLSILLDILAYNTHYNAYLANMLANEMFLDSAVKRESAVSIAKHLGYTPHSARGATATVDITVNAPTGNPISLTIEKFFPFTTSIGGTTFTFVTTEPATITPVNGVYTFTDVVIKEGKPLTYRYTVGNNPGPAERFEIPNPGIDTTTLTVRVQNSSSDSTVTTYTRADDVSLLTSSSEVFFLQQNPLGNFEIYFGDGVIGKKLTPGNIVIMDYLVTEGPAANTSSLNDQVAFSTTETIGGSSNITITVTTPPAGGVEAESITSIKFNAPLFNSARNRAVTINDYAAIIRANYPEIETVAVWGGETNDPPAYGKVFISAKPFNGVILPLATKNDIANLLLENKQILTITPEFVDPEFLYLHFVLNIKYDSVRTDVTASQINSQARTAIIDYMNTNLNKFNKNFYASDLTETVTNVNSAILSTTLDLTGVRSVVPILNVENTFKIANAIKFNGKVHPGDLRSSKFFINVNGVSTPVRFKDVPQTVVNYEGTSTVALYNTLTNERVTNIGTIDYSTGILSIEKFTPIAFAPGYFDIKIYANYQRESFDIVPLRNEIITYDPNSLNTDALVEDGITISVTPV